MVPTNEGSGCSGLTLYSWGLRVLVLFEAVTSVRLALTSRLVLLIVIFSSWTPPIVNTTNLRWRALGVSLCGPEAHAIQSTGAD